MKHTKLFSLILVLGLLAGCGTARVSTVPAQTVAEGQVQQTKTAEISASHVQTPVEGEIGEEEAMKIALEDAGVKENEVTRLRVHLSYDDRIPEYEVDFYVGNQEYDYDIAVSDGKILSKDYDIENDYFLTSSGGESETVITEAEAIEIALQKVPGAVAEDVRIHTDRDDGRLIYEGSLFYEKMEYDFEIDAETGVIVEWEKDSIYD